MPKAPPAAISIDMGGTKIYGIVQRLSGDVLAERTLPTRGDDGTTGFDQLARLVDLLQAEARAAGVNVVGVGLGVPGMARDGRVIAAPALGWLDEPVAERLRARCGLPVVVENDANLAALGEYGYGAAQGASSLVCVTIGTGIGSGVVIGGKLVRGAHSSTGEIGYMVVDPAQFEQAFSSADFGAFERLASGTGIETRARAALAAGHPDRADNISAQAVIGAAEAGEAWAATVVDETIQYLSLGLANITALLDPEVIVLSGGVMQSPSQFVAPVERHLRRLVPFTPRIVTSTLGPRAAAFGATQLVATELVG